MFFLNIKIILTRAFPFKYMLRIIFINLIVRTYYSIGLSSLIIIIRIWGAMNTLSLKSHTWKGGITKNRKTNSINDDEKSHNNFSIGANRKKP